MVVIFKFIFSPLLRNKKKYLKNLDYDLHSKLTRDGWMKKYYYRLGICINNVIYQYKSHVHNYFKIVLTQ